MLHHVPLPLSLTSTNLCQQDEERQQAEEEERQRHEAERLEAEREEQVKSGENWWHLAD